MEKTLEEIIRERFATGYDPVTVEVSATKTDSGMLEVTIEGLHYGVEGNLIINLEGTHGHVHQTEDELAESEMIEFFKVKFGMASYAKSMKDDELIYELKNDQDQTIITGTIEQLRDSVVNEEEPVEGTTPEEGNTNSPSSTALASGSDEVGEPGSTPDVSEPGLAAMAEGVPETANEVGAEQSDTDPVESTEEPSEPGVDSPAAGESEVLDNPGSESQASTEDPSPAPDETTQPSSDGLDTPDAGDVTDSSDANDDVPVSDEVAEDASDTHPDAAGTSEGGISDTGSGDATSVAEVPSEGDGNESSDVGGLPGDGVATEDGGSGETETPDKSSESDAENGTSEDSNSEVAESGEDTQLEADADNDGIDDILEKQTTAVLKHWDCVELKPVSTADSGETIFALINHGGDEETRGTLFYLYEEALTAPETSEG